MIKYLSICMTSLTMDKFNSNNYSIVSALRKGNLEKVEELINSIDFYNPSLSLSGYFLLCHAINSQHEAIIKLLINKNVMVNCSCNYKKLHNTPLHLAILYDNYDLIEILLAKKVNIDIKNQCGKTPLELAIMKRNMEIIELILNNTIEVNISNNDYTMLLYYTINGGFIKIAIQLLSKCFNNVIEKVFGYNDLLYSAIDKRYYQIVKILVDRGVDINSTYSSSWLISHQTPLHHACKNGDYIMVQLLLNKGADVDIKDEFNKTPLHVAVQEGHVHTVVTLLNHGADVNSFFYTFDDNYYTALLLACEKGNEEIAKLLLNRGADVNIENKFGLTAFSLAVRNGHSNIAKILLDLENTIFKINDIKFLLNETNKCKIP